MKTKSTLIRSIESVLQRGEQDISQNKKGTKDVNEMSDSEEHNHKIHLYVECAVMCACQH